MAEAVAEVGVSTAFRKACNLHDMVRQAIDNFSPNDFRYSSPEDVQKERNALKMLRGLLEQMEDRLRECRLIEASGAEPQNGLMCDLDQIRRSLISVSKQALTFVVQTQGLVSEVLDFCEVSPDELAALRGSMDNWTAQKVAPLRKSRSSIDPGSASKATASMGERRLLHSTSGAAAYDGSCLRSSMDDWYTQAAGYNSSGGGSGTHSEGGRQPRQTKTSGMPPSVELQALGPKLPRQSSGTNTGDGSYLPDAQHNPVESTLALKLRSLGNQASSSPQDVDSTSTCSSKEQWLIAAALAPHHVRVVHDAVAVKPPGSGINGLGRKTNAVMVDNGPCSARPRWTKPLKVLAAAAAGTVLLAAGVVSLGVAVEDFGSKLRHSNYCTTDEVELEPDLPQLPSKQQQRKRDKKGQKGRSGQQQKQLGLQQQVGGNAWEQVRLPAFPIFPAPDASAGQG